MKYTISESQYKKILLNYLNNIASDFIFEDDVEFGEDNWVDIITSDDVDFGSVWFKTIRNIAGATITRGCDMELALDDKFMQEFEGSIPVVNPKIFSQVVLEYFKSKTEKDCDCLEFSYFTGEYDQWGDPLLKVFHYNTKKQ